MTRQCAVCTQEFDANTNRKTCSSACAHRAQAVVVQRKMLTDNPMKRADVAKRMSETRSARFQSDPEFREQVAAYTRKAWADGKYEGVKTGMCKWYAHTRPDGSVVKLQGTWEVVMARHLDSLQIAYDAHVGRIPYKDGANVARSYYPDFYVPAVDSYIDVKGAFWDKVQSEKFSHIFRSNPNVRVLIANRGVFKMWNIDVDKESKTI